MEATARTAGICLAFVVLGIAVALAHGLIGKLWYYLSQWHWSLR
jgi:hypothetical protein